MERPEPLFLDLEDLAPSALSRDEDPPSCREVDKKTFAALKLGKALLQESRGAFVYGSENQRADLLRSSREDEACANAMNRIHLCRDQYKFLKDGDPGDLTQPVFKLALRTALSQYYGTGNCDECADQAFARACASAPEGYSIVKAHTNDRFCQHAYTLLYWNTSENGENSLCDNPVVVDPWPSQGQVCLWSDYFANPKNYGIASAAVKKGYGEQDAGEIEKDICGKPFTVDAHYVIDAKEKQMDIVDSALSTLGEKLQTIRREDRIPPVTRRQVEEYCEKTLPYEKMTSTLAGTRKNFLDYTYRDKDSHAHFLSTSQTPHLRGISTISNIFAREQDIDRYDRPVHLSRTPERITDQASVSRV